jgi:hypothetical protein
MDRAGVWLPPVAILMTLSPFGTGDSGPVRGLPTLRFITCSMDGGVKDGTPRAIASGSTGLLVVLGEATRANPPRSIAWLPAMWRGAHDPLVLQETDLLALSANRCNLSSTVGGPKARSDPVTALRQPSQERPLHRAPSRGGVVTLGEPTRRHRTQRRHPEAPFYFGPRE